MNKQKEKQQPVGGVYSYGKPKVVKQPTSKIKYGDDLRSGSKKN